MTRLFLFHYNFNTNLHNNSDNSNNSSDGRNSGNNLTTNINVQLDNMDSQFRQKSRFDKKISKHLIEISLKFNHSMAYNKIDLLISQNIVFSKCITSYFDRVEQILLEFTNVTENTVQYDPTQHTTHRDLITLMDHYFLTKYYKNCDKYNSARLKSQSTNGASKWMHVPYHSILGKKFSNQQFLLPKSLYLGAPITQKKMINCNVCNEKNIDQFGYHALSCPCDGLMTKRHDAICDKLFEYCEMADLKVEKEKRYESDQNGNMVRITCRPDDIKIYNYITTTVIPKGYDCRDIYIDVTVANITANTYIEKASKKRGAIAALKEIHKDNKYKNKLNIKGIALEVFGAISNNAKDIIHYLANRISLLKNQHQSIWINRIRSNLLAVLMQYNAQMMIKQNFFIFTKIHGTIQIQF